MSETFDDRDGKNPEPIKDPANDPHLQPVKPGVRELLMALRHTSAWPHKRRARNIRSSRFGILWTSTLTSEEAPGRFGCRTPQPVKAPGLYGQRP
jgi:hypothetical protein